MFVTNVRVCIENARAALLSIARDHVSWVLEEYLSEGSKGHEDWAEKNVKKYECIDSDY